MGLEMITKIKERCFKDGIKKRVQLYDAINRIKGGAPFGDVEPVFTRGLPKNTVELAGIVSQLSGIVPDELLLSLLPFIKDPKDALAMLKKQKEERLQEQQRQFGMQLNADPAGDADEE